MAIASRFRMWGRPDSAGVALRTLTLSILLMPALTGCKSLYLHSDATQQATGKAKAELDKVNIAAVFDNEATYLENLQKIEYAAVADSLGAQRDAALLNMLQGMELKEADLDGRALMARRIDGYLKTLVGSTDRGSEAKLTQTINTARASVSKDKSLAKSLEEEIGKVRLLLAAPAGEEFPEIGTPSNTTVTQAIEDVKNAAEDKKRKESEAKEKQKELQQALQDAAKSLSGGKPDQKAFDDALAEARDFLKKAREDANPYLGLFVTESLQKELDDFIKVIDPKDLDKPADSTARAGIAFVRAAVGVGDAFANPPRVPHPNALAATQAWLRYEASGFEISLRAVKAKEAALNARLNAVVEQVYYLSRAGQSLQHVYDKPAHKNSEGMARLLESKGKPARDASEALYYYSLAWSKGFIPTRQINEVSLPLIDRQAKLQLSRQAGEAWLGTLKPAVATLAAYGEGGLDPHILAELLQVLGIGAIAVGVN